MVIKYLNRYDFNYYVYRLVKGSKKNIISSKQYFMIFKIIRIHIYVVLRKYAPLESNHTWGNCHCNYMNQLYWMFTHTNRLFHNFCESNVLWFHIHVWFVTWLKLYCATNLLIQVFIVVLQYICHEGILILLLTFKTTTIKAMKLLHNCYHNAKS